MLRLGIFIAALIGVFLAVLSLMPRFLSPSAYRLQAIVVFPARWASLSKRAKGRPSGSCPAPACSSSMFGFGGTDRRRASF